MPTIIWIVKAPIKVRTASLVNLSYPFVLFLDFLLWNASSDIEELMYCMLILDVSVLILNYFKVKIALISY